MNRVFAAVCLVFLPLLVSAQEYKLVWEDNFNAPVLNNSKWTAMINGEGAGNRELQYYRRENISLGREK